MIDIQLTAMVMDVVKIVSSRSARRSWPMTTRKPTPVYAAAVIVQGLAGLRFPCGCWVWRAPERLEHALPPAPALEAQMYAVVVNFCGWRSLVWRCLPTGCISRVEGIKKIMPIIRMIGIIFTTTAAAGGGTRQPGEQVGFLLCFAMLMHNPRRFLIGYLMYCWILRMDVQSARTVAFKSDCKIYGNGVGLLPRCGQLATVGPCFQVMTPLATSGRLLANHGVKGTPAGAGRTTLLKPFLNILQK